MVEVRFTGLVIELGMGFLYSIGFEDSRVLLSRRCNTLDDSDSGQDMIPLFQYDSASQDER